VNTVKDRAKKTLLRRHPAPTSSTTLPLPAFGASITECAVQIVSTCLTLPGRAALPNTLHLYNPQNLARHERGAPKNDQYVEYSRSDVQLHRRAGLVRQHSSRDADFHQFLRFKHIMEEERVASIFSMEFIQGLCVILT
jgi:hypothetical protein